MREQMERDGSLSQFKLEIRQNKCISKLLESANIIEQEPDKKAKKYISPVRLVVVAREGERIVFPVSEVYGFIRYSEGMLQPLPVTVSGSKAAFTRGIISVEDFDAGFLDERVLFDSLMKDV